MLKYTIGPLSLTTMAKLAELQAQVDALSDHEQRYQKATQLFKNKSNQHFEEIKARLAELALGGDACYYCERDRYRDIEHIRPKRHYPAHCFDWFNYVYACVICNQDRKRDRFAVFDANGAIVEFDRTWPMTTPIPVGQQVLIDMRSENPLDFLHLDLGTGEYIASGDERAKQRGTWTRDLFELNDAKLVRVRKQAYESLCHYLARFQQALATQDKAKAALALDEIRQLPNPTVLVEMRKQMHYSVELTNLFKGVPPEMGAVPG